MNIPDQITSKNRIKNKSIKQPHNHYNRHLSFKKLDLAVPFLRMGHLKAHELIQKNRGDLLELLAEYEKKLFEHRSQVATQSSRQKYSEILNIRRDVARIKTALMEQQRKALAESYKNAKHVPKDIRPNVVKARRQQLPAKYANKLTTRAAKRARFLKPVKYALKAE